MSSTMLLVDKRAGRSLAATSVAGPSHPSRLFYILDKVTKTHFLVDTGAEVSVIPPTRTERSHPDTTFSLQAVDGSQIATYGVRSCTLNVGLRRTFRWVFIVANVTRAIIGADFLHHFGLNVDIRHRTLVDSTTQLRICGLSSKTPTSSCGLSRLQQDSSNPYLSLLAEFPAVTQACAPD